MNAARSAAVLTWVYAAGFGLPAIPVSAYLLQRGRLPTLWGLFEMYGGPWSARVADETFALLLMGFLVVTCVAAWTAWLIWKGRRRGAGVNLLLLPVEAVFWVGFALPFPWLIGIARAALIASAWRSFNRAGNRMAARR